MFGESHAAKTRLTPLKHNEWNPVMMTQFLLSLSIFCTGVVTRSKIDKFSYVFDVYTQIYRIPFLKIFLTKNIPLLKW